VRKAIRLWPYGLIKEVWVEFLHLEAAQVCDAVAGHAVVVEQPPAALVLHDAVVRGPSYDGLQQLALEAEGSVGVVADGEAEQVTVAGGIGEEVLLADLVHPGGLEEAVGVAGLQGLAVGIEDDDAARCLGKLQDIIAHADNEGWQRGHISRAEELCLAVAGRAQINAFLRQLARRLVPLELTAPETAEVAVDLSVVVLEDTGVDAERAADGVFLRDEGALGALGDGHAQVEDAVVVLGREDEVVAAVLLHDIAVPHLLLGPRHLIHVEHDAVVGDRGCQGVALQGENMVVAHLEVAAVIVEGSTGLDVVRGVDVQTVVEDMD